MRLVIALLMVRNANHKTVYPSERIELDVPITSLPWKTGCGNTRQTRFTPMFDYKKSLEL